MFKPFSNLDTLILRVQRMTLLTVSLLLFCKALDFSPVAF